MNKDLQDLIISYATSEHSQVSGKLLEKSKDNVIAILMDLLANYFNDKNSSSLRENVIVSACGFEVLGEKIGYNGYRQNGINGKTLFCEAKPKNINTNDKKVKKLDGGGNFTDYTWSRFERDKKANPMMILGGFIDGRLIYIFQFPFNTKSFLQRLEDRLKIRFPNGDLSSEYLRSAQFRIVDYLPALTKKTVKLFVDKETLDKIKPHLTKPLYDILERYV